MGAMRKCWYEKAHVIGVTRATRKCWDKRTTEHSVELLSSAVSWFDLEVPEDTVRNSTGHKSTALRLEVH